MSQTRAERRAAAQASQQTTKDDTVQDQSQEGQKLDGAASAEDQQDSQQQTGEQGTTATAEATSEAAAPVPAVDDKNPSLANVVVVEETQPKTVSTNVPPAAAEAAVALAPAAEASTQAATTQAAAAAPAISSTVTVTRGTKADIQIDDFEVALANVRQTGTVMQKVIVDFFDRYLVRLEPKLRVSDNDMFREQLAMWTMFNTILDHSGDDEFDRLWHMLSAIFERRDVEGSALHDTAIFRGTWMWPEGDRRLQAMTNIITLIKATYKKGDAAKNLKYIDMEKILTGAFTDRARTRLLKFYGK